jgi:hypothetical protein
MIEYWKGLNSLGYATIRPMRTMPNPIYFGDGPRPMANFSPTSHASGRRSEHHHVCCSGFRPPVVSHTAPLSFSTSPIALEISLPPLCSSFLLHLSSPPHYRSQGHVCVPSLRRPEPPPPSTSKVHHRSWREPNPGVATFATKSISSAGLCRPSPGLANPPSSIKPMGSSFPTTSMATTTHRAAPLWCPPPPSNHHHGAPFAASPSPSCCLKWSHHLAEPFYSLFPHRSPPPFAGIPSTPPPRGHGSPLAYFLNGLPAHGYLGHLNGPAKGGPLEQ